MATACTIDENGIQAPSYEEVLAYLQGQYRAIYGADLYLESDSQDGQLLALFALALHDNNSMAVGVYNAFNPTTAQGTGLSSVVKVNGIARLVPSASTADVIITGDAGTVITNGAVRDSNNQLWSLPASVTIPLSTSITVTATCQTTGAVSAAANSLTRIATPTRGWVSVTNPAAAVPGAPVETDAALRQRQARSVALPSRTVLEGLVGAIANIAGVTQYAALENDTGSTDSNGLPAHSIAVVALGGDSAAIAEAIAAKKGPGVYTAGTTSVVVYDVYSVGQTIRFYRPTMKTISVAITIKALTGYSTDIGNQIKAAVATYISGLGIGGDVLIPRLYLPAQLRGGAGSETFELLSVQIAVSPASPSTSDIAIAFNELATCADSNVALTVTT